jgi:two-component system sensor histidine kinase KdpD
LALAEIAHLLDRRREKESGVAQSGADRIMVCLSSGSPKAESLLRKAARLATRLNAPWYAVFIQTPRDDLEHLDHTLVRRIENNLALAHQLGGVRMTFKGQEVVSTIAAFVKEYGISQILMGRTLRPWYRRWFGQSILDRLLARIPGVDVTIVDTA